LALPPAPLAAAIILLLLSACRAGGIATQPSAAASPAPSRPAATASTSTVAAAPTPSQLAVLKMTDLQITSQAGYYIADEKGYLREEGIQLEYVRGNPA